MAAHPVRGAGAAVILVLVGIVTNNDVAGLLAGIAEGDLDAVPILCDLLEERGDARAVRLRSLYVTLCEDRVFAPVAFRHYNVTRLAVLPMFPEYALDES
jgi:hypothetical protein